MGQAENAVADAVAADDANGGGAADAESPDGAWAESLRVVMREVIASLPDHATLGELIEAANKNRAMSPVLGIFTVQELIDTARKRPKPLPVPGSSERPSGADGEIRFDEEGNPIMDLDAGPKVIRRRADVPDGDVKVLRCLAQRGPQRESDLSNQTNLTSEQLRIIVRHLRTKGFIHVEGSGTKRRLKITRHGSSYVRKQK
jgi:predicted transcriptional regulator